MQHYSKHFKTIPDRFFSIDSSDIRAFKAHMCTSKSRMVVFTGLLEGPLNPCGQVIPAAYDPPGRELVVSVIPLPLVPSSKQHSFSRGI